MYQILLFLHFTGVFMIIAGTGVGAVGGALAKKHVGVRELAIIAVVIARAPMMAGPGGLLAMLTGVALVWRQGFGFHSLWVILSMLFWLTNFGLALGFLRPRMGAAMTALANAQTAGKSEAPEVQAMLTDRALFVVHRVMEVNIVLMVLAMVFKPQL
jgi:hypothetical protein